MKGMVIAAPVLAVLLAGCATITPQEQRAADDAQCRDYGFRPNTAAFAECRQRIDLDRSEARRDRDRDFFYYRRSPYWY